MFDDATITAALAIAKRLGVEPGALLGIAEVESGGHVYAAVGGRKEPLIRFEGHYFDRRLADADKAKARKLGLAAPRAGAVANPASQAARWKLLDRAAAINRQAAYESTSWGLGQVMGAHWAWLGYASVDALVEAARAGAAGQMDVMARYIEKAELVASIRKGDWAAFARGYNGPGYRANKYDTKMAAAAARWNKKLAASPSRPQVAAPPVKPADSILKRGSKGPFVSELQDSLNRLGYGPLTTDGDYGAATEKAVRQFQTKIGLTVDGWAGPRTLEAVGKALEEQANKPKMKEAEARVPETATDVVKEETNWLQKITGGGGIGGLGLGALFGVEWTTLLAIAGVVLLFMAVLYFGRRRLVSAYKEINAELKS